MIVFDIFTCHFKDTYLVQLNLRTLVKTLEPTFVVIIMLIGKEIYLCFLIYCVGYIWLVMRCCIFNFGVLNVFVLVLGLLGANQSFF